MTSVSKFLKLGTEMTLRKVLQPSPRPAFTAVLLLVATAMLTLVAAVSAVGAGGPAAEPGLDELGACIDDLIVRSTLAERFNGVALVAAHGHKVLSKGYGWADQERHVPCAPDTRFLIGSTTKTFTAVLILQLVAEGRLSLDSSVADLLPYYRKDTGRLIQVRHLLAHTCGLSNYMGRDGFLEEASGQRLSTRAFVEKYCMEDLEFEPGTQQKYTNTGFFVLGAIVEALEGRPFASVLKDRVLGPAGLRATAWASTALGAVLARSYERGDGRMRPIDPIDPALLGAAGALTSTAEDLFLWDRALAGPGLLPLAAKQRMFTVVMGSYALGWNVKNLPVGPEGAARSVVGHDGGISGYFTHFRRIPDDGHLIVLLSNAWDVKECRALSDEILDLLYGRNATSRKAP